MCRALARIAAGALALAALIAAGGRGGPPAPRTQATFTLASGFQPGYGAGPSALGPDGTAWIAQSGFGATPTSGFEILALADGGRRSLKPVATADGAGSVTNRPAIAPTTGGATFVWQTATGTGGSGGVASIRARSCTLRGCGAVQTLASWRWSAGGAVGSSGFSAVGDAEPAVAPVGGRAVAVFLEGGGRGARMAWSQASAAGRFGTVHVLAGPAGTNPVLVSQERGGGAVAAWIAGALPARGSGIEWAAWTERGGFGRPRALAGAGGIDAGLVGAPAGGGVALAWLEGGNAADPVAVEPVWFARRGGGGGGFARPALVFGGDAAGLALSGGGGTLALAFAATSGAGASTDALGPAWVKRSAGGAAFGTAVDLDPRAAPYAAVSVAGGEVVAAWNGGCEASGAGCQARVAIAGAQGAFGAAIALGAEDRSDAPALHSTGDRTLVTWASGGAVRGAIVAAG